MTTEYALGFSREFVSGYVTSAHWPEADSVDTVIVLATELKQVTGLHTTLVLRRTVDGGPVEYAECFMSAILDGETWLVLRKPFERPEDPMSLAAWQRRTGEIARKVQPAPTQPAPWFLFGGP